MSDLLKRRSEPSLAHGTSKPQVSVSPSHGVLGIVVGAKINKTLSLTSRRVFYLQILCTPLSPVLIKGKPPLKNVHSPFRKYQLRHFSESKTREGYCSDEMKAEQGSLGPFEPGSPRLPQFGFVTWHSGVTRLCRGYFWCEKSCSESIAGSGTQMWRGRPSQAESRHHCLAKLPKLKAQNPASGQRSSAVNAEGTG